MQLTLYTDYSLRVLVYLSMNSNRSATISEIAEFYAISRNHLVKVVHNLSLKKYINSSRGKGGGLRLADDPSNINLGSVIRDTEPNFHTADCLNTTTITNCKIEPICHLKSIFSIATDRFLHTLDEYTIADIINFKPEEHSEIKLDALMEKLLQRQTEEDMGDA